MKIAFTICSNNYLAQAKVLGDSFLKHNKGYRFFIGLADGKHDQIDYALFSDFTILPVGDIGINNMEELIAKYNIIEFNTGVKPFFFDFFFKKYAPGHIIYLDPDIAVFAPFTEIEEKLETHGFLLTPHLLTINPDIEPKYERLVLNVGIFNLGFLALKNNRDSLLMLEWWKIRMEKYCYINFCDGLFVDQIWANYIPAYFSNYYILRDFGYNIGYWNFEERMISKREETTYYVNDISKLVFFHFSNFNPLKPGILCKWLDYSFDKRPDLVAIYQQYADELLNNQYQFFSALASVFPFKKIPEPPRKKNLPLTLRQRFGIKIKKISDRTMERIFNLERP